jgi:hypothetical protein
LDPTLRATARKENILWSAEEDAFLTEAQKKRGNDWGRVAAMVPGRTNKQCRHRWVKTLDPDISAGKWTPEEDAKLTAAVTKIGKDWVPVAAMVPGRTNEQCRYRWTKTLDPDINTGKWSGEEDENLTDAVHKLGSNDWAQVAVMVPGRTNAQCWSR